MPCETNVSMLVYAHDRDSGDRKAEAHLEVSTRSRSQVYAEEIGEAVVTTRAGSWTLGDLQVGLSG